MKAGPYKKSWQICTHGWRYTWIQSFQFLDVLGNILLYLPSKLNRKIVSLRCAPKPNTERDRNNPEFSHVLILTKLTLNIETLNLGLYLEVKEAIFIHFLIV